VDRTEASTVDVSRTSILLRAPVPRSYANYIARKIFLFLVTLQELGAFALITLGVCVRKLRRPAPLIRELMGQQIARSGVRLLPMFVFVAVALGFLVIGQTVAVLARVGAIQWLGSIMVVAVVRELGPLLAALLVLARVGTANVVELGTVRALGEIEALEALRIDPVHYLVVPRVVGMAVGTFALTVYLILGAVLSGYLWAFLQDVPIQPGDYFSQLAGALTYLDFALLALKTAAFGFIIAIVTCYHGLARKLPLEDVSNATVRAVAQSIVACVLVDALFILVYLNT
jgi:phospholipid/cholesterol/gamma-HCH transport system permease protein